METSARNARIMAFPIKIQTFVKNRGFKKFLLISAGLFLMLAVFFYMLAYELMSKYYSLESIVVTDRNGETIAIKPNSKGNYADYKNALPERLKNLLIAKEDKYFYKHPGLNPVSALRAILIYLKTGTAGASSTITQQLVKNLLGNEQDRTVENKLAETLYAVSLEVFRSKDEILKMYGNTVYMGNGIQGLSEASEAYFGKELSELNDAETLSLLATISGPSTLNPWKSKNLSERQKLAKRLEIPLTDSISVKKSFRAIADTDFELETLKPCSSSCVVTLDSALTDSLREMLDRNLSITSAYGGRNGAIVVVKLPENELLAVVGTPNPRGTANGSAINMALQPRPIGSTVKPLIYLKAFEKGLRPYSLVDDREYKFSIAKGFPLYPKNYDGTYRGSITLHEALSNSLNVPTVKTLEYVGLADFYSFLERDLEFKPLQSVDNYAYGIALGGLEMDPLTLAHLMTLFGNKGELKPLTLLKDEAGRATRTIVPKMETNALPKKVADEKYVQLVNKITSDRIAGVEQFGLASNLNLSQNNYSVKTGTSRDFHDTWAVGFTPDFLVTVWLGNAENEPMRDITSSTGAGKIWHDAMQILMNSEYNKKTPLDFSLLTSYEINGKLEYGLAGDDVKAKQNLLSDTSLITNPHDNDIFFFEPGMQIPLRANSEVKWYVGNEFLGQGKEVPLNPKTPGSYEIRAKSQTAEERISIKITKQ